MGKLRRTLRKWLFGLSLSEACFDKRGFYTGDAFARERLERAGRTFLLGYNAAIEDEDSIERTLNRLDADVRGFAYEGAAMALSLLDGVLPGSRRRWESFLHGPGAPHAYMVHVGAGWALARLRRSVLKEIERMDPLLRWLAVDGYGFHHGYFAPRTHLVEHSLPDGIHGYGLRAFTQGLGRSLWFAEGGVVSRIVSRIEAFPEARRADLWSGVGLACAYAGGVGPQTVRLLRYASGRYYPDLAQGVAFAAKARQRAGNPAAHTEIACQIICGMSLDAAAWITDDALFGLVAAGREPAYEHWRRRIQNFFAGKEERLA